MRQVLITSSLLAGCLIPTTLVVASDSPDTIELTGVVRDFRERTDPHGHTDFERKPSAGFGHYVGNIAYQLGDDGKPVFTGNGQKVNSQARDSSNRTIAPHLANRRFDGDALVNDASGDHDADLGVSCTGGVENAESFDQWFRDMPGINLSQPLALTFVRQND
ncbi:MAG: hypothetical protein AAF432_13460, partial [Planctomycetota bacterium]